MSDSTKTLEEKKGTLKTLQNPYVDLMRQKIGEFMFERDSYKFKSHVILSVMSIVLFIVSLSSITSSGFNPFIYFRF